MQKIRCRRQFHDQRRPSDVMCPGPRTANQGVPGSCNLALGDEKLLSASIVGLTTLVLYWPPAQFPWSHMCSTSLAKAVVASFSPSL